MCAAQKPKKARREKPLLETVSDDGSCSFAKALGSVDFHTRERGLQALTVFLRTSQKLTPLAMRKLWKGLFYCFWHSDKAPAQEALAVRLAAILPQLTEAVALQYFGAFIEAMQREWFGIDRLRLDKFLMLVRKFVRQLFVHLQACDWQEEVITSYRAILEGILNQSSEQTAAGLSFHLVDVFVPELLSVLREERKQISDAALQQMLQMFIGGIATSSRASLPPRVREGVFEPLLAELRDPSEGRPLQHCNKAVLAEKTFETGAQPGVKSKARDILYELSATLEAVGSKKRKRAGTVAEEDSEAVEIRLETINGVANGRAAAGGGLEPAVQMTGKKKARKKEKAELNAEDIALQEKPSAKAGKVTKSSEKDKRKADPATPITGMNSTIGGDSHSNSSQMAAPVAPLADLVRSGKPKSKKARSLDQEAVARAAERAAAAVEAQKQGKTTVHPATPGTPSENNYTALLEESLEAEAGNFGSHKAQTLPSSQSPMPATSKAGQATTDSKAAGKPKRPKGSPATPAVLANGSAKAAEGTPGRQAKHVTFRLKRNLYFQQGGAVPSPDLRTPDSCRPKGSALKQQSKFSRFANQSSHSANGKRPVTEMKASRPINTGRGRGSKRRSI